MIDKNDFVTALLAGESRINNAPSVMLDNGKLCIPQHFLTYRHTQASVEKLVLDIEYDDRYIVFVGQEQNQVYLQVGIVGVDNYRVSSLSKKLVYGRKWRVESELPTSEIIQTVFLALKKAREHEVRELFRLNQNGKTTQFATPFNCHHDLPLIAQNAELIGCEQISISDAQKVTQIKQSLNAISYDDAKLTCIKFEDINGQWLVQLHVDCAEKTSLPELINSTAPISFILSELSTNEFYHQLMDSLISLSNRHVDEHFTYKNIARFSRNMDVEKLAKLSSKVRKLNEVEHKDFLQSFVDTNYQVDQTRVPKLNDSELSIKIRNCLNGFSGLDGILP